jgi:S1-C subfamily serine protease
MNAKNWLRLFHGIIITLFLLMTVAIFRPYNPVPPKNVQTSIEQDIQSKALKQDAENSWIRENLAGSVVTIESHTNLGIQLFNIPEKTGKPIFQIRKSLGGSLGAGVVIKNCQGCILTAKHVLDDSEFSEKLEQMIKKVEKENPGFFVSGKIQTEYTVTDHSEKKYSGKVMALRKNDMGLLRVKDWKNFLIPGIEVYQGKDVSDKESIIIGAPYGVRDVIYFDVHTGDGKIIDKGGEKYTKFTAPIVPGNSGGPVIMLYNYKIAGIVSSVIMEDGRFANVGLMIPSFIINEFLGKVVPKK